MKYFAVLIHFFVVFIALGQTKSLQLKEFGTDEPVPFVKVSPIGFSPQLADLDGIVSLPLEAKEVRLHCLGFKDTTIMILDEIEIVVFLMPAVNTLDLITVIPGENPAHRIIDLAIANRKKNDPLANDAFRYESYSKFIFDVNREKVDSILLSLPDTASVKKKNFLDEQHILILESTSTREFSPPSYDKEEITAYKVSGFTNPALSTFANEVQGFSFYENQFSLLGTTYLNPIAFGGTKRYLFILEDTLVNGSDTTFTIFYRPRKGKNFDGLTGRLYINTLGYAVEKVTAAPYPDTSGVSIQITQEYKLINAKKWFPTKLSSYISFGGLNADIVVNDSTRVKSFLEGRGSSYIRDVQLNPGDISSNRFNPVTVVTKENAGTVGDSIWSEKRAFPITEKEKRTYFILDSLSQAENLEQRLTALSGLIDGKLPMGKLNLDLTRLINYRQYEGVRLGLGLETSTKFSKAVRFGGYFGWGFGDKAWKYGGFSTINIAPKIGLKLHLRYHDDLLERGGMSFEQEGFLSNNTDFLREIYILNMEKQRLAELTLRGYIRPTIKVLLSGNYQRIGYTDGYRYYDETLMTWADKNDIAETSVEVHWNLFERVMILGDKRISKGTRYPRIKFKLMKGWKGIEASAFDYWRFHASVHQTFSLRGIGKWDVALNAGITNGSVPLFLLQVGNGTRMNWNVTVPNTFETMFASEFYAQRHAALFTRLSFNAIKTKAKWNEPQFTLHHAVGYGINRDVLVNPLSSFAVADYRHGYWESGISCNSILVSSITGIGIAGFYRYGPYASSDWRKNIVPKITLTILLN